MRKNIHYGDLPKDVILDGEIAVDTEAMGLQLRRDRLCLVQIATENEEIHLIKFERKSFFAPNLCKVLQDEKITKVFHFARFDVAILRYYLQTEINNIYCTKIASRLARTYTESHSLKALCGELLHIKLNKEQQSSDWGNSTITEKQFEYAAGDVEYLLAIKNHLEVMVEREGRTDLLYRCFDALQTIIDLDLEGWVPEHIFNHHVPR